MLYDRETKKVQSEDGILTMKRSITHTWNREKLYQSTCIKMHHYHCVSFLFIRRTKPRVELGNFLNSNTWLLIFIL